MAQKGKINPFPYLSGSTNDASTASATPELNRAGFSDTALSSAAKNTTAPEEARVSDVTVPRFTSAGPEDLCLSSRSEARTRAKKGSRPLSTWVLPMWTRESAAFVV